MDNSNGDNRRFSAQFMNGSHTNDGPSNKNTHQNHVIERSLDLPTSLPPIPPTRTAHIHNVNSRKSLSFGPTVVPQKLDSFNTNHVSSMNGRGGINGSDMDGNSSSSSPPTDSISQKTSKIVAATATMPRNLNGGGMNGRKKKSVTIGTFTTVETFDPSSYEAAAV